MTDKSDGMSFRWSLSLSLVFHMFMFILLRAPLEYGRKVYYSSLPVELYNYAEQQKKEEQKNTAKEKPAEKKKKEDTVNLKKKKETVKQAEKKEEKPKEEKPQPQVQSKNVAIDIKEFPFAWYLDAIEKKIRENWEKPQGLDALAGKKAVIYFRIMRNGEITDTRIETQSGDTGLDITGLRAIKNAGSMPPLPAEFSQEYLSVHYSFEIY